MPHPADGPSTASSRGTAPNADAPSRQSESDAPSPGHRLDADPPDGPPTENAQNLAAPRHPTEPPLPPLPDGGLAAGMPDWLRAAPDQGPIAEPPTVALGRSGAAPSNAPAPPEPIDPTTFLTEHDLPDWIRRIAAADALPPPAAPPVSRRQTTPRRDPPAPPPQRNPATHPTPTTPGSAPRTNNRDHPGEIGRTDIAPSPPPTTSPVAAPPPELDTARHRARPASQPPTPPAIVAQSQRTPPDRIGGRHLGWLLALALLLLALAVILIGSGALS